MNENLDTVAHHQKTNSLIRFNSLRSRFKYFSKRKLKEDFKISLADSLLLSIFPGIFTNQTRNVILVES